MFSKYWNDPLYRFLTKAVFLFIAWYFIYDLWLHPLGDLDMTVIKSLEQASYFVLELFGYITIEASHVENIRTIGIDGTHGLWIGDPCNGLTLFALFTGFIIAYPGPLKKKLWFIPAGIIVIHIINILRIVSLSLIVFYFPDPAVLDFNHTYTFTLLVYGFVFLLWYLWALKLSGIDSMKPPTDE
ncbi:exosortase/archaeosortase family protein [Salibacteraceae bacterium]|jgi:exosortase family protein XrtF|nr:exosortase/archaeosortase family protein [Salibacteraceae bacterium]MDB9709326.1 exosortase/archaeosortase family protein [Salibacteraceae bacterium]HAQ70515.1 exosortase/archaeosortase family protein [Flavobacteriales bacterium]